MGGGLPSPPEYRVAKLMPYGLSGGAPPLASGLFLDGWLSPDGWLFLSALRVNQRQVIFGVERVATGGLLSGGTQGDVHAAIIGQDHHGQILEHLLGLVRSQFGIPRYLFLYLLCGQFVVLAKRPCVNMVRRDAVFDQEIPGTLYTTLRQAPVVCLRAAWVCMTTENQVGIRPVFQIFLEVRSQVFKDFRLTIEKATLGILGGGPSGLKVNAMERKSGFQLLDLRGRSRRRRRRFAGHYGGGQGPVRRSAVMRYG